jgi:biofilm PGA synthesis N-glycosyltransferase PgaC
VRKGFRYLYVPDTYSFEPISKKMGEQGRQKVRRASRLIQSTILNMDFFFNRKYGTFGMTVFPLRFMMFLVCPFLTAVAIFTTFCGFFLLSEGLFVGMLVVGGILLYLRRALNSAKLNSIISLLFQQFCLIAGLVFARRKMSVWQRVLSE